MKRKKKLIQSVLRKTHKNNLKKTIGDVQKTWKLIKWTKNKSILFKSNISFFKKRDDITAFIKRNKIQCFIEKFFFFFATVVLNDFINDIDYLKSVDLFRIFEWKIQQIIENTVFNKVFKNNNIFNVIFKRVLQRIFFVFNWIYNTNLKLNYYSTHFKNSITVFLRKINNFDYVIFKFFRFIILFNIINKIIKLIIIICFNYTAKIFNLLFENYFENRKCFFFKQTLHYIIEKIHLTWINKKIVFMFMLNVINVFFNVFQLKLFHNLWKRRISNSTLQWIKNFLTDKHIILRLINIITKRVHIFIDLFQNSFMSSIFYLFYNVDFIEFFINSLCDIFVSDFINDVIIIIINDFTEKNLITLASTYKKTIKWMTFHESMFISVKYEFIHFKKLLFEDFKFFLWLNDHILIFSFFCKYLKIIMNCQFIWKFHLQHLKKKTSKKFNIFTTLTEFIWNIDINDFKHIYFIIVFSQFTYCVSIWYMFFKNHEFKQKQNATFTIIRGLQVKIVRIIVDVFKFIVDSVLNIKLFLWFIEQQLNKMIFNFFFRIKISFWYKFIINHCILSN